MIKEKTKRQLQAEQTKELLYETAKKMVQTIGYDKITINDITDACGVAKGTFYHYFKSKDEILSYLERSPYKNLSEELDSMEASYLEKLQYYIDKRLEIMSLNDVDFTRQWLRHASDPSYHELYGDDTKIAFDIKIVKTILEEGLNNKLLKDDTPIDMLSQHIIFTLQGTTVYYCMMDGEFDVCKWGNDFYNYFTQHILSDYIAK